MAKQQTIRETAALTAAPVGGKPGRLLVTLITPGQGRSGYYSPEVLEAAAADAVFPAGTQMYLDHPTESEVYERPERSVKDIGAVLAENARWDGGALVAEADTFSQHRELLSEMQAHIGVSVRAAASVSEAKGGPIIEKLIPNDANTADFVTRAGRGGSFTILESARPGRVNERALKHDNVTEATVNDQREILDALLKSAHGGDKTYVWLRDFDDTTAWFEISTDDSEKTFAQSYTTGDNGLADTLTGERTEVRQVTTYVPAVTAGQSTESHQGDAMGTITIEESALSELRETAGRVTALESERDTAVKERDEAQAETATLEEAAAQATRTTDAEALVVKESKDADIALTKFEVKGMVADLPIKEGALNVEAFTKTVQENLTEMAADTGRPRGFGSTVSEAGTVSVDDFDAEFTKEA